MVSGKKKQNAEGHVQFVAIYIKLKICKLHCLEIPLYVAKA